MLHPKKVGKIPIAGTDKIKQTNEIKMVKPLLNALNIDGLVITADALLTQREIAKYLVEEKKAHYHFTVKGNQKTLLDDITFVFKTRQEPDAETVDAGHGRIETRRIWVTNSLNDYLNFPYVKQVFAIEREFTNKKTGVVSKEVAYGMTSQCELDANAMQILHTNRGHWCIENSCHYILDWVYDEDRCRIRTGYGPENISRIRRFAIGVIKSVSSKGVAETTRDLVMNVRLVFDYLKMTKNSQGKFVS